MIWKVGAGAAALLVVSALLAGCDSSFNEQRSAVLVANETTTDIVVRLWPAMEGGSTATYRIPAGSSGFVPEKLGFFEGEILDDGCLDLAAVESLTTYANTAFMRVTVNGKAEVAVEPVLLTANVDQSQWPQLAATLDCPEPNP